MVKNKTEELIYMVKDKKRDLNDIVEDRVRDMLQCNPEDVNKDIFYMKLSQTKLGMTYIRDREIMKRVNSGQMIRVVNLISTSAEERAKYIKASMPEVHLQLE